MIEYNYLLNDIIFSKISNIVSLKLFLFIIIAFLISFFIDIIFGELPTRIHPVVIIGSLISFFKDVFIKFKSRMSGMLVVLGVFIVSSVILYVIYMICSLNAVLWLIVISILL